MDFLDPKKQRALIIRLLVGYVLIGIAVVLATIVLLYQIYGYGLKNGQVIQNGLVFVSSTPHPADIYINDVKEEATNARIALQAGQYTFTIKRPGYIDWRRAVTVEGGSVEHFDYPFLVPRKLSSSIVKKYSTQPNLLAQSPDRRWLLAPSTDSFTVFDEFDLKSPQKLETKQLELPAGVVSSSTGAQAWQLVEWSTDNRHVLLQHDFQKTGQKASEYILLDRQDPAQSFNLSTKLNAGPTKLQLRDKKYDRYYLYDQTTGQLSTATLKDPQPQVYLQHVIDFKSYGKDRLLYATDQGAPAGQLTVKLRQGNDIYPLRNVAVNTTYLLDMAQYSGDWYITVGASSEGKVYIYKNPVDMLTNKEQPVLVPLQILKVEAANYVAFSKNARFIVAENSDRFAVYDAETDKAYAYQIKTPLDTPQPHAVWMDGHRLSLVSSGRATIFDFDSANSRGLVNTSPNFELFFDSKYEALYGLQQQSIKADDGTTKAQFNLTKTYLRVANDL